MEPSPEVLAFAQPLAPAEVLAAPGPVAALLSAATAASLEEEVAAAEVALGEAVAVGPRPSLAHASAFANAPARPEPAVRLHVQRVASRLADVEALGVVPLRLDHHGLLA